MGRHSTAAGPASRQPGTTNPARSRLLRGTTLVVLWLGGIAAGLFALVSAAARFTTCSADSTHLACRATGTTLGVALTVIVIATVAMITVTTYGQSNRWTVLCGLLGLALLAGCLIAARALLSTA